MKPLDAEPSPAARWLLTAGAVALALAAGALLTTRAASVTAGGEGVRLQEAGATIRAYPLLLQAVESSTLQSKPCVDLGNLAVWAVDDGNFQEHFGIQDPWSLAKLAFHSFAEGLDRQPGNPAAWAGMAELFKKVKSLRARDGAIDLDLFGDGGQSLFDEEDRLVVAAYLKAIDLEPNNYFHHAYLGDFHQGIGSPSRAIRSWARSVELMPDLSWHYYLPDRGLSRELYTEIAGALQAALETNPSFAADRILENMGELAERAGDVEAALQHYEAAAEVAEDPSVYLYLRGNLLFKEKRYAEAEPVLLDATRRQSLQPSTLALSHTLLGRCRLMDDQVDAALGHLQRARRLNPAAWYIAVDLARAYERSGRQDKAEAEYKAAIRLEPDRASVYSALIDMYRKSRQVSKAIPLAEKLVNLFPENRIFKDQLDALYREIGRPQAG